MKVKDVMTTEVVIARPDQTISGAARMMAERDSGALPVGEDDEDVEHVADNMGEQQVRRLPVLDRDKRLVGIVSLGDLAAHSKPKTSGQAIAAISRPGGRHDQTLH